MSNALGQTVSTRALLGLDPILVLTSKLQLMLLHAKLSINKNTIGYLRTVRDPVQTYLRVSLDATAQANHIQGPLFLHAFDRAYVMI